MLDKNTPIGSLHLLRPGLQPEPALPNAGERNLRRFVGAAVKYATNHLIRDFPSYAVRHAWYRHLLGWYIGPGANILTGQTVEFQSLRTNGKRVSIGAGTRIDHGCLLSTAGGLLIGDHVCISPGVWLVTRSHDVNDPTFQNVERPIVIDSYVWIGPRATILGGITVGEGAIVMTGSVVTQDVEPYCIVSGVPACVVGARELRSPSYSLPPRSLFE